MIKIKGKKIEPVEIAVSREGLLQAVERELWSTVRHPGQYINSSLHWETDHGGHGRGYQEQHRVANADEAQIAEIIIKLRGWFGQHDYRPKGFTLSKVEKVIRWEKRNH